MVSVRLLVEHTFYGPDGTCVVCTTLGEAFDSGDKASNKAMAVALKYALTETLMIPTYEADRDTEEQSPEVAPQNDRRPPQQHRPPPNGQGAQPPGREPGSDDDGPTDEQKLAKGIAEARNMNELRALVGLRDKIAGKNTQHPLRLKFVEKYRALEAQQKGQAA